MFAPSYNPFESSLNNARTLAGVESFYVGLKNQLGKVFLVSIVLLLGLPLVFFFGFWLSRQRRKFLKFMRKDYTEFNSSSGYSNFKKKVEELDKFTPYLKKLTHYNPKRAPLLLRFTISQMQKTSSTLLTFEGWLRSRLDNYNKPIFLSNSNIFRFLSEKELWERRNKVYEYWM
jgi:hypothetical protein